jgi:hypothetical protein
LVLAEAGAPHTVETYPAFGIENALRLAGSLRETLPPDALIGVIVDADDDDAQARQSRLGQHPAIFGRQVVLVATHPTLEGAWLGITDKRAQRQGASVEAALESIDLDALRREPSFARFAEVLERHVRAT